MSRRLVLAFPLALALSAQAGRAEAATSPAPRAAAPCLACHGRDGIGIDPSIPSLAGQPASFLTLQMILFREGLRQAPAMERRLDRIPDATIERIAVWFASLPPPQPRPPDPESAERGAALAASLRCASCHGAGYAGSQQVPRLSGQHPAYLRHAMAEYRDNRRSGSDTSMNDVVHGLTDAQLDDLASHAAAR